MDMEAGKTLTNEEVIRELLELLKKNAMKEQANDVFEICSYVDGLEKKIDSMTEELTNMQNQIKEMQEDTLVNNAKKALSEAQERLNARCEQIKLQVLEVKTQVKSIAKSIVDEAKEKGRSALYRVSEFLGIKKRLLDIRENVRGAIKTTDKDIAKTALLAKGFREAGQTAANAFRTFADKPEVDYSQKEQKHPITKAVLAPMKAVRKLLVSMEMHLDASIDKLDNLDMTVQFDKEKRMEHTKDKEQKAPDTEREIIYSPMVAEPQEYKYNADAFAARKTSEAILKNMRRAIFPGTFDPFTIGHYSVVKRALTFMDEVVIGIGINENKKTWFPTEKRVEMIEKLFADDPRVKVDAYDCLTIDFARAKEAQFIVRGIRTVHDFEYEETIADINRKLAGIETILLFTEPELTSISSTIVRELLQFGKDVTPFLPEGMKID